MGVILVATHPHRDTVARTMLGQVAKVETAVAIRSLGQRERDLRPGVPRSQHTCVEGETLFCRVLGEVLR